MAKESHARDTHQPTNTCTHTHTLSHTHTHTHCHTHTHTHTHTRGIVVDTCRGSLRLVHIVVDSCTRLRGAVCGTDDFGLHMTLFHTIFNFGLHHDPFSYDFGLHHERTHTRTHYES
jgi:hypothetical protein